MKMHVKIILKWVLVVVIIGIIIYTFRDSAGPIMEQLRKTKPYLLVMICVLSMLYQLVESAITMLIARKYVPDFSYKHAFVNTFNCSFYRVATLGSGAGIAAIIYLSSKKIAASKALGLYSVEYALHKISIAILAGIYFVLCFSFMMKYYGNYASMLLGGFAITFIITLGVILFSTSKGFHKVLLWLANKCNHNHKFDQFELKLKEQCIVLEEAAAVLLNQKTFVVQIIILNFFKLTCWYLIPYFILQNMGLTVLQCLAVTTIAVLLAAIIPTPAGIGSTEFMLITLFSIFVGTAKAGALSLLYRFATFVFPFIVGAIIVIVRRVYIHICMKEWE